MTGQTERRVQVISNLRALDGPDGPRITGYAAVFDQESVDLGGFREVIHRGAFAETIRTADIRGLVNHDPNLVLGRNLAGTLELAEDDRGLRFVLHPPDTAAARDLLVSMKRGDVDQMSFGFQAVRDRWEADDRGALRHLLKAELFDVSVVTFPAYPQTSADVRARARTLQKGRPARGATGRRRPLARARLRLAGVRPGMSPRARRRLARARLELARRGA